MVPNEQLLARFVVRTKRERYVEMISNPKKRPKFIRELDHFKSLDERYMLSIKPSQQSPENIAAILVQKGAPRLCWVTSANPRIDGKELPLLRALQEIVGCQRGAFISCIPGRLVYFEAEDRECRWILERLD